MTSCFSFVNLLDKYYNYSFSKAGLKPSTADFHDGTFMHCWVPKTRDESKPTMVLLHGMGANAKWQWGQYVSKLSAEFNLYVPDLLFFGDSYTTRSERSANFQGQCVMEMLNVNGVRKTSVVGVSYGGAVAYWMAVQFKEKVEKVVLICPSVSMHTREIEDEVDNNSGDADTAANVFFPQTPAKLNELIDLTFYKSPRRMPDWFAKDFIRMMCKDYFQERKELIQDVQKSKKLSDLPRIIQPTLMIWGEYDKIFPLEWGNKLKSHVGENAELVVVKDAGHAITSEKTKELCNHMKAFLIGGTN